MGCCCSCCCCVDSTLESCGNITFPTILSPSGTPITRTNKDEPICHNAATYFTVPLCEEHRDALKASIARERRNLDSVRSPGPLGQTCLSAEVCKIPKCNRRFYCRASLCSDHYQGLAKMAGVVNVPLRERVVDLPSSEGEVGIEVESPRVSELDGEERRRVELPDPGRAKAPRFVPDRKDEDEAPPPYESSASPVAASPLQRRVKRSGS